MSDNSGPPVGTLCWCCGKCYGGCSWSRKAFLGYNPKPVEGWEAIQRNLKALRAQGGERTIESYVVLSCPEFALDPKFEFEYMRFSKLHAKRQCRASARTGKKLEKSWKEKKKGVEHGD